MTTATDLRRQRVRAAVRIHEHLIGKARTISLDHFPEQLWNEVRQTVSRLRFTQGREWTSASQLVQRDLGYTVVRLTNELQRFQTLLSRPERHTIATPGEILADLAQLAEEFEQVQIDLRDGALSVQTEPIVLDGFDLGSFRISLAWELIGRRPPYEVLADEPYRPNGHDSVTHPHVRDSLLCEGEGAGAIKSALTTGRLLDFFVLVRQVLRTYNPGSAFVQLEDWSGIACRDCGHRMDSEDHSICDRCEEPVCSDCSILCSGCDCWSCASCSGSCFGCGRNFCGGCLSTPAGTSRQLCESCREKGETSDDEETNEAAAADAVRLGEAAAAA